MQIPEGFSYERALGWQIQMVHLIRRWAELRMLPEEQMPELDECQLIIEVSEKHPDWPDEKVLFYADGIREGEYRAAELGSLMLEHGCTAEQFLRIFRDHEYRAELCREYCIDPW